MTDFNNIDLEAIARDGYFTKWPHDGWEANRHEALIALIGVRPRKVYKSISGHCVVEYDSINMDVEKVVTVSSETQWINSTVVPWDVHTPVMKWENTEDIIRTARYWIGLIGEPNWSLVRDDEWIANLRDEALICKPHPGL